MAQWFKDRKQSVAHNAWVGQPSSTIPNQNACGEETMNRDCPIWAHMLVLPTYVLCCLQTWNLKNLCLMSPSLIHSQTTAAVNCSLKRQLNFKQNGEKILKRIVIGNEMWLYHKYLKSKQFSQWKHSNTSQLKSSIQWGPMQHRWHLIFWLWSNPARQYDELGSLS